MPWGIILIVAGLVVVFVTTYTTLGLILFGFGLLLILLQLLLFLFVGSKVRKAHKDFDKRFNQKWGSF